MKRFDSWSDFVTACDTSEVRGTKYGRDESRDQWYGGLSFNKALRLARTGDESTVERATALLDKLEAVEDGLPTRQWSASPYGAYPCVPDYLAGMPDCMRTLAPTGDVAPVSIYVSTSVFAGFGADQVLRRGVATLALALKLQQVRPVDIFIVGELDGNENGSSFLVIPLDSRPLCLAQAAYALTNVGFARRLQYGYAMAHLGYKYGGYSRVPYSVAYPIGKDDLYVPTLKDGDTTMNDEADAVRWINQQIKRYSALQD